MAKKRRIVKNKRSTTRPGFQPGRSGNPRGRPRGALNKTTREAKALCNAIVDDPAYLKALKERMIDGKAGAMEPIAWYYAKGKPKERLELDAGATLAQLLADITENPES